ncbi:MAG TPA: Gfo/Idh/MocA family oxidoreductase [Acidimicrobiales bacterium]|nr:Gfo/Idh/MocA family oxidoreductase [Acidimicrobiales bacterium]
MRVGLVGYGLSGRFFHRPLIAAVPGLEITSVVTSDPERRRQAASELPGARLSSAPEELLRSADEHDLIVVATATATHAEVAGAALRAGLHVVVEKPVAPTAAEVRALAEVAASAGRMLVPFHNRRFDADHLTFVRLRDDGVLGTVLRYESRFERFRPLPDPGAWRERTPSHQGGGILLDLGTHLVDQAVTLFGRPTGVYAEIDHRRGGADDDVFLALDHRDGTRTHLWAGALAAAPGPRLRVLGTEGALVVPGLDGQEARLRGGMAADDPVFGVEDATSWGWLQRDGGRRPVAPERGDWPAFYRQLRCAIAGEGPPPVTVEDALCVAEVLDAARRSAEEGAVVRL